MQHGLSQNIEAGVQETSICTLVRVAARSYYNVAVNFEVHQHLSNRSDLKKQISIWVVAVMTTHVP